MIISLSEIMSAKEKTEHRKAPLELKAVKLNGMEYPIAEKEEVSLTFVTRENRQISLTARTSLALIVPCGRCLDDVRLPLTIEVIKELDFKKTDDDRIRDLDEINFIDGYNLDVDMLIFDEILLNFPQQVLCGPDCRGLCKVCGINRNKQSCDCDQSVEDPRMSVIQDIFKNYKEV